MANPFPPAVPGVEPPLVGGNAPGDPIATALPLTYRELYADASKNPNPDRTARYLAGYRFTDATAVGCLRRLPYATKQSFLATANQWLSCA